MMWMIAQTVRSAWLFFPVALYICGYDYEVSFYAVSSSFALLSFFCFFYFARLRPSLTMSGWVAIRTNAIFLSHSFLLAIHRQVPRIVVARLEERRVGKGCVSTSDFRGVASQ